MNTLVYCTMIAEGIMWEQWKQYELPCSEAEVSTAAGLDH